MKAKLCKEIVIFHSIFNALSYVMTTSQGTRFKFIEILAQSVSALFSPQKLKLKIDESVLKCRNWYNKLQELYIQPTKS